MIRPIHTFAAAYAALLAVALVPLGLASIPPLLDYPNHLARMHILVHGAQSAALQASYAVNWAPLPNLAMDALVPAFAAVMPLELAGRVFVGLTLALISSGTAALHFAVHRRVTPWPLLSFLFLYNFIFLFGFVNYFFGMGVFLWTFAAWIHFRNSPLRFRLPIFSALTLVLYFSHIYALGLYGLAVAGHEFSRWRDDRTAYRPADWLTLTVPFIAPTFVFLALTPIPEVASVTGYGPIWSVIGRKLGMIVFFADTYSPVVDGVTAWALACLVIFGFVAGTLKIAGALRWPLIALAAAYVAMPSWLFSSAFADVRLPVALAFLFIAGTSLEWRNAVWKRRLAVALLALFAVRMAVVAAHWQAADRVYAEYLAAFEALPVGSRLLPVYARRSSDMRSDFDPPIDQIAALAVITRSAFVPTMYARPTGQPIAAVAPNRPPYYLSPPLLEWIVGEAPGYALSWAAKTQPANIAYLRENWRSYDYLLVLNAGGHANPVPAALTSVYRGGNFELYRITGGDPG